MDFHFRMYYFDPIQFKMGKAAWITLGLSCTFTASLIYLVHRQQRVEKKVILYFIILYMYKNYNLFKGHESKH